MTSYAVQLAPGAARAFEKLPPALQKRLGKALTKLAADVAQPGRIPGKSVKTLRGTDGTFHRLRVGEHRVMYDVIEEERVVLVLGIVHRSDLERWLRNR